MAGLNRIKTGTNQTSWEYYIEGNEEWLSKPLRADIPGKLVNSDGTVVLLSFSKNEPIQILDLNLHNVAGKKLAKVEIQGIQGFTEIKNISKPTTIARTREDGSRTQEDQENIFIDAINEAVAGAQRTVKTASGVVKGVISAAKNAGTNGYGKEKYADVILQTTTGVKGVSMKETRAPSLFGGGFVALYDMDPNFIRKVFMRALNEALKSKDFEVGSDKKLKDIFIEITNKRFIRNALVGTAKMGGPVDYMFIGPKRPKFEFKRGVLKFTDANIYTIDAYQRQVPSFWLRIRRRTANQIFTDQLDKDGLPYFFKLKNGMERARIVVDKKPSSQGLIIRGH